MRTAMYFHRIESDSESVEWKRYARGPERLSGNRSAKVEAIKAFRGETGAGLKEAKDAVEEYIDRLADRNLGKIGPDAVPVPRPDERIVKFNGGYFTISPQAPGFYSISKTICVVEGVSENGLLQTIADLSMELYNQGPTA